MTVDGQKQLRNYPAYGKDAPSMAAFGKSTTPAAAGLLPSNQQRREAKRVLVAAGQGTLASASAWDTLVFREGDNLP